MAVIKLGLPGALRDYTTEQQGDGIAWERGPANPFAARVNSSGKYDEVDIWNDWVQEDWQAGVGRVDPEEGGFLFSETETRVPGQIILPPLIQQCDTRTIDNTSSDCRYMPTSVAGNITVGSGGYMRVAMAFTTPATLPATPVSYAVYCRISNGVEVKLSTYSNNAGSPDTLLASATLTGDQPDKNFHWYSDTIANTSLATGTLFWLVIEPVNVANSLQIAYASSGYDTAAQGFTQNVINDAGVWGAISSTYLLYTTGMHRLDPSNATSLSQGMVRFNGNLYCWVDDELHKYDATNEQFDVVGTITDSTEGQASGLLLLLTNGGASSVTSAAIFGPNIFFGRAGGNYTTMDTDENFAGGGVPRKLFLEHAGYLYGAYQNDLYYTADGSLWSAAFPVGGDAYEIRGLAGMGSDLYMATDKALFRFAPGEVVEEIAVFGATDAGNGVGMVEYQSALYIPASGRIFRFDQSGQMMDIWVSRDDEMPNSRIGRIAVMARMNNWLLAYVLPPLDGGRTTVWAWQEEGWHFISNGPSTLTASPVVADHSLLYDRATQRLWMTATGATPWFVEVEDYTFNPFNSTTYKYQPYGWIEQDRFYGGQYLLGKSWESVTIVGDNLSSDVNAKVYVQDESSTTWELVGSADSDGEELRWADYTARPSGKWIRLGLLLQSNSSTETPRVRAVIVKFLPYPNDRITDSVTLILKNYVQMPDGDPSDYTLAQQKAHIESLIESVSPIIYEDVFETRYEVTITSWRMMATRFEHFGGANVVSEMRVPLVLEQVPDDTYGTSLPFSDDFNRGDDIVDNGWIGATWLIVNNAAVNTPTLGSELIVNGDFDTDTDWTKGDGWSIAGGVGVYTADVAAQGNMVISQDILTAGQWYSCRFVVNALSDGVLRPYFNMSFSPGQITVAGTCISSSYAVTGGTTAGVLASNAGITAEIDDVSFKLVTLASLFLTRDFAVTDVIVSVETTVQERHQAGVVLNLDDPANPANYVLGLARHSAVTGATNVLMLKYANGIMTELVNQSSDYVAGNVVTLEKSGTTYTLFYNGAQVAGSQTIADSTIVSNTFHGLFSSHEGNRLDNVSVTEN